MSSLGMDFILTEILPRLPGKSLMRFKSFNSVISSPDFPKQYLRYHTLPSPDLLILHGLRRITCYDLDSNTATATFHWPDNVYVYVVGSSNGLLCLYIYSDVIQYLCVLNPTTRVCQDIPFPLPGVTSGPADFGFAFDPNNLDFKIVEVSYQQRSMNLTRVYSLNTKSWTVIQSNLPGDSLRHGSVNDCGTLINNHLLHWTFYCLSLKRLKIDCFDVCKNEWLADVLLPHFYYDTTNATRLTKIGVLYDSLFASFFNNDNCSCDVWVKKEYEVRNSWFKLLSIPFSDDLKKVVVPVACRGGFTEVLIRQHFSAKLLWYNRSNGKLSEAKLDGAPDFFGHQACLCSTSIVDLPDGKLFADT